MAEDVDPQLVADWWEYWRRFRGGRAERKELELGRPLRVVAAADGVQNVVDAGGLKALDLVDAVIQSASSDDDLALVGAGPLEDLINAHGDALVDELERRAATSARFRSALHSVYLPDHLDTRLAPFQE